MKKIGGAGHLKKNSGNIASAEITNGGRRIIFTGVSGEICGQKSDGNSFGKIARGDFGGKFAPR